MSGSTAARSHGTQARDAVVTGVGFCLPGRERPVLTADDLWQVASHGETCLVLDDFYFGSVNLSDALFAEILPDMPDIFARNYTSAHRFGLVSLVQACADARLDFRADELTQAAILVGRGGIDANIDSYLAAMRVNASHFSPHEATELFAAMEQAITPSDVALVQGGLTRTKGPCYTVSSGCASSALQIGNAHRMIASGEADVVLVTGVDVFRADMLRNIQQTLLSIQERYGDTQSADLPTLPPPASLMRPYDRRGVCVNYGEGAATVILEARDHATRRGAHAYGQVLAQATVRDGLAHPLAPDETGAALATAARRCLGDRWTLDQIPYVHGACDGQDVVNAFEAGAVRELYGAGPDRVLMTSQEGCFGHNGAPAGCLGVALTLLMMERDEVCPTTNCEEPLEDLAFDPVPGTVPRQLDFDYALNFNHQLGGLKSAILLGGPEVATTLQTK
ncbi:beta-ketoacyl synthase N-terminal-like domain-containing protein [Streptomyces sioyaensis]|uniref:beta-ketoacyl synthase N-terminal-like domain-containing protein n=1 Tax=Streptomyces sioyaensis TaxID=67364 RepID=UPI0037D4C605